MVNTTTLDLYGLLNMLRCVVTVPDRTDTQFPNLIESGKLFWGTGFSIEHTWGNSAFVVHI